MRYGDREREPHRDYDDDYRSRAFGNGGRYGENRPWREDDERERGRDRGRLGSGYDDSDREDWPRQSMGGPGGKPSWLRSPYAGGYGGSSTYGSVFGSPYNTSYNDPWFRERAWRPDPGWEGRGGEGRYGRRREFGGEDMGGYGGQSFAGRGYESQGGFGGYGDEGGYGSQGGFGSGYGSEDYGRSRQGQSGYGRQGGFGGSRDRGRRGFGGSPGSGTASWRSGGREQGGYGSTEEGYRAGEHYGRGPKGYQRSDERLREEISDRLMADPDIDASQVSIDVKNAEVTLEGTVESRRAKREIEDLIEEVMGVKDTNNRLRVQPRSYRTQEWENEGSGQKSGMQGGTSGSTTPGSTSSKSGKTYSA